MSETDIIAVGSPLPRIGSATPHGDTMVAVDWAEPEGHDVVDLAPLLFSFRLYRPLRDDRALFGTVRPDDRGARLVWGADGAIDMPADAVWELARQQMSSIDFAAFLRRFGRTLDSAAAQLGISRRLAAYYAAGDRPIPRYIALACARLDELAGRSGTTSSDAA